LRILEGYGVTETAPVLAINTPMFNKHGTVGRLMPGVEGRLEPVPGVDDGGRLFVRSPNVMLGYVRAENHGVIAPPPEGWHDTGHIVSIDGQGFVTIKGRAKRFAKIGGEMVSLAAVETLAADLWPDATSAATTVPDLRKGERLILFTECAAARLLQFPGLCQVQGRLGLDDSERRPGDRENSGSRHRQGRQCRRDQAGASAIHLKDCHGGAGGREDPGSP